MELKAWLLEAEGGGFLLFKSKGIEDGARLKMQLLDLERLIVFLHYKKGGKRAKETKYDESVF